MTNNKWCDGGNVQELVSFCAPDLEYFIIKRCPFYLAREFSGIIATPVYIPPQAETKNVLKYLHLTLKKLETAYPEAAIRGTLTQFS